jgi:hypothetical protein
MTYSCDVDCDEDRRGTGVGRKLRAPRGVGTSCISTPLGPDELRRDVGLEESLDLASGDGGERGI